MCSMAKVGLPLISSMLTLLGNVAIKDSLTLQAGLDLCMILDYVFQVDRVLVFGRYDWSTFLRKLLGA